MILYSTDIDIYWKF